MGVQGIQIVRLEGTPKEPPPMPVHPPPGGWKIN
jgi:hypothetical protein